MDVMSVQTAAKEWELSERRVQKLCEEGRIRGAARMGRMWLIPKSAARPEDMRKQRGKAK